MNDALLGLAILAGALYALMRSSSSSGTVWGTDETAGQSSAGDSYGTQPDGGYAGQGEIYDVPAGSSVDPWASGEYGAGTPRDDPMGIGAQEGAAGGGLDSSGSNMAAMLAVIRAVESRDNYYIIAGGDRFTDTREHPFVLNPQRRRPLGTTASGAYQMVVGTWTMARDALGLRDFSPASQDAAAAWIIQYKRPASYAYVLAGRFADALAALRREWEAFDKMLSGTYPVTLAQAASIFEANGGTLA